MKTNAIKGITIPLYITSLCLVFLASTNVIAQNNIPKNVKTVKIERAKEVKKGMMVSKLTDDQKAKLKDLRLANAKAVELLKAESAELAAHLRMLNLAENPDNKAIFKTIDQMTAARGELMKKEITYKESVKSLLTPEQLKELQIRELNRHAMGSKNHNRGPQANQEFKRKMMMQRFQKNSQGQGPMMMPKRMEQGQMRQQGQMMNRPGQGGNQMMQPGQMQKRFQVIKQGQPKTNDSTNIK